ncbi:MAG: GAF domain-containing protein [Hyphomicrobiaceae bacterium]
MTAESKRQGEPAIVVGPAEAPSGLPVLPPLAAVIEILVLVVVPGLLDYLVPAFPTLNDTQPHFFWLPVLLLTLQYGSASGLLAAGSAILLASLLGWPEQEIGENHFSYLLRIWLQPVLWIATAVILGQLRLRQIERKQALGRAVAELTGQRQAIAEHAQHLRERCDRLERVIASRRQPDGRALLAELGRIRSPDSAEAFEALARALTLAFGESIVSVHVAEGAGLRLAHRQAPAGAPPAPVLTPDSPLYRAVVSERRSLVALAAADEAELGSAALAAVPIVAAGGRAMGALLLETASPADLDEDTVVRLSAIAAAVADRMDITDEPHRDGPQAGTIEQTAAADRRWRRVHRPHDRQRPGSLRSSRRG